MGYVEQILNRRFLLKQLIRQQILLRYRRTLLGYLWTLVNPLLMMAVTSVVFAAIFKMDLRTYAIFLFSGIVAFNLFATIVAQCAKAIVDNESIIKKIFVPKILFPLSTALTLLIDNFLMFLSLFLIVLVVGGNSSTAVFSLAISYILLFCFALGLGLITSIVSVYFRDLLQILTIFMQALVFLSPVYYKPENLGNKVQFLINLNPLTQYIKLFREPIYHGTVPSIEVYVFCFILSVLTLFFGLAFFKFFEHKIMFRL